jgi:hypothetical protein
VFFADLSNFSVDNEIGTQASGTGSAQGHIGDSIGDIFESPFGLGEQAYQ